MRLITAVDGPKIDVWWNGQQVSQWCSASWLPNRPRRWGLGWVDALVPRFRNAKWSDVKADPDGGPVYYRRWGFVRWAPMQATRKEC